MSSGIRLTTEQFVEKAKEIHENKYDYSLVDYKNNRTKIEIICPIHGKFEQNPYEHIKSKYGCPKCSLLKRAESQQKFDTEHFIKEAKSIHGDKYDYSITEYKGMLHNIKFICPLHGQIEQKAQSHLMHEGCKKCSNIEIAKNNTFDTKQFIEKAKQMHGDKYDYSLVDYTGCNDKVKIICPIHGIFEQCARTHYRGSGCPECKISHGNRAVKKFLNENNILFEEEWNDGTCKYKGNLYFDFYLPEYKTVIEFQGKQHFKSVKFWGGDENFKIRQERDQTKREWCLKNNIKEIEILNIKEIKEKLSFLLQN